MPAAANVAAFLMNERRVSPLAEQWDRDRQTTPLLTYTESRVTNAIKTPDAHRTPLPCEAITYEFREVARCLG